MSNAIERLPVPTAALVRAESDAFDSDPWVALVEKTMGELLECFPANQQLSHVLFKVIVLDNLYSTRVKNIHQEKLARRIVSVGIDNLIKSGSLDAVNCISNCEALPNHYSFASKFCCWHNPTVYPIYDGNVDECLWVYRNQGQANLDKFHRKDLYNYGKFVAIIRCFQERNGLQEFSLREIDKYLWRAGDRILKARKVGKKSSPAKI